MQRQHRVGRHKTIRKHLTGTIVRPRLAVFRSSQHIYAQIIDDTSSKTMVAHSNAKKAKITTVVFDRGGFIFQGRVEELAKGAREGGLKF